MLLQSLSQRKLSSAACQSGRAEQLAPRKDVHNSIAMFSQPFASRTSLVCVHSLILLVRTETEGLRRRLWGRSAPLLLCWESNQHCARRGSAAWCAERLRLSDDALFVL